MRSTQLRAALLALPAMTLAAQTAQTGPAPQTAPAPAGNPFFEAWKTPFGVPPFDQIRPEHFMPALKAAMAQKKAEVRAIAENPQAPTFHNTVEALAESGAFLTQVEAVFGGLSSADTNGKLQAVEREIAPVQAALEDDINLDPRLFQRVKAVHEQRASLKLTPEQKMLLERTYKGFVRGGAALDAAKQARYRAINQELATLGVAFSDHVLKETQSFRLVIDRNEDLAGLPEGVVAAGAEAAKGMGLQGRWVYTLQGPSIWPFLQYAQNRELRKRIMEGYLNRCDQGGEGDNKALISRIISLRVEQAQLLGYKSHSDFVLEERMAKTPAGVLGLMEPLWRAALKRAKGELAELQALADKEGAGVQAEAWDWRYYAEKLRKAKWDLDENELRPYFAIDQVRQGAFHVANRLYGLTFTERKDLPVYNPEVNAWEVKEKDGRTVGILYTDDFPRPGKRNGAWCGAYRKEMVKDGVRVLPVVVNVGNYTRPTPGKPALVSLDDVETIFHEFGHGLHQLLSQCRYAELSGTSVPRDFVELPSQIMENWALEPEVLRVYARHWQTGERLPEALIRKIQASSLFNQGFAKTEFMAAALLDMDWSMLQDTKPQDATAFEKASLAKWGLIRQIPPRYRTPYFLHLFTWGYASGYYSYLWSEVLDSDAFQAFKEKGDLFHPATAEAFRKQVLEKGGSEDPAVLYRRFRGRDPKPDALLEKRGLK